MTDTGPLFARHRHLVEPVNGALLRNLSPTGQLSFEITFDASQPDEKNELYVNLVNATRDYLVHVSIRLATGRLVLNVMKDGAWGEEVYTGIDFAALRYWRFWLVVDAAGAFAVRLGPHILCMRASDLPPQDIAAIESNVSVCAALPAAIGPGDVCAVVNFIDHTLASTLLFIADDAGVGPKALRTSRGPLADIRRITLAGQRWWHCLAEFGDRDTPVLQSRQSSWQVQDVLAEAVVEIDPSRVALRSPRVLPEGTVAWVLPHGGQSAVARPAGAQGQTAVSPDLTFRRHVTALSDLVELADEGGAPAILSLQMPDMHGTACSLSVDPKALGGARKGFLTHPCVLHSLRQLAELRRSALPERAARDQVFAADMRFCWDADEGAVDVRLQSEPGSLLRADIGVSGKARSITLNVGLGSGVFQPGDTVGLVFNIGAAGLRGKGAAAMVAPFVRSAGQGGHEDTPLSDALPLGPVADVAVLVHKVAPRDALTWRTEGHTLVVPLPVQSLALDLREFRLFYLPSE